MSAARIRQRDAAETSDALAVASGASWWLAQMERPECSLLSSAEERALAVRAQAGDKHAREQLITHNLRLVIDIARRYVRSGVEFEDVIAAGNRGLMHAIDKYDVSTGCKLSTYATTWIRQKCGRLIQEEGMTVRIPSYVATLITKVRRFRDAREHEEGHTLTWHRALDLALEDGVLTQGQYEKVKDVSASRTVFMGSLDEPLAAGAGVVRSTPWSEDDVTLGELVPDTDPLGDPAEALLAGERIGDDLTTGQLARALTHLTPRERFVIEHRYGLNGNEKPLSLGETAHEGRWSDATFARTLEEVAEPLGLTRERVRQIEYRAISKLKPLLAAARAQAEDSGPATPRLTLSTANEWHWCEGCQQELPLINLMERTGTNFGPDKTSATGYKKYCRACRRYLDTRRQRLAAERAQREREQTPCA